ncbi:Protein TIFY 10A [Forsythia ovata]|uniref:Protein TIFY n=1 Tax=Forsythia ovata TaxID=205694 RepID=A0ABD1P4U7_9LAMI
MDSGRFSGQRSNFSQTCSLLSQYLKEKGSFGDLTLGLTQNFEPKGAPVATGTLNFFPVMEKSGSPTHNYSATKLERPIIPQKKTNLSETKSEPETAQMTIFYGGQVIVFNDFPAEKAEEIMLLAGKSSAQNHPTAAFPPPSMVQSPAESATNISVVPVSKAVPTLVHNPPQHSLASDLPIARKNSLARFLEKRKDRITSKAPYQAMAPPKPIKSEEWLGLAPQFPTSN